MKLGETIPDKIDENWDQWQEALEEEVEERMQIAGDKL
jgi:enolase